MVFRDDESAYRRLVEASDFSRFRWHITHGVWEEFDLYFAYLRIPNGLESIPKFLRDVDGWALLAYDEGSGIGQVNALVPPSGPRGVTVSGVAEQ